MLVSDPGSVVFFGHEVGQFGQAPRGAEKLHCRRDFFWRCFSYRADYLQEPRAVLGVQSASGVRNRVKSGTKCQVVIEAAKTHVSPAMQSIYFYKLTITDHSSSNLQVGIYIYIYIFWVFGCDEPELLYEFMRDPLGGWKKKLSIAETGNRERGN